MIMMLTFSLYSSAATAVRTPNRKVAPSWKQALLFLVLIFQSTPGRLQAEEQGAKQNLSPVELTVVDAEATGYGTFQSHNQKVVSNANGIFMTHIRSLNEAFTAQ